MTQLDKDEIPNEMELYSPRLAHSSHRHQPN